MQEKEYGTEIDLLEVYGVLKKRAILIVAITAIVTVAVFSYFKLQVNTPVYRSTSLVRVECPEHQKLNNLLNEKNLNQALIMQATSEVIRREVGYSTLINTYAEIIKSQAIMSTANELASNGFGEKIYSTSVNVEKVNNSQIMSITVKNVKPELAEAFNDIVLESFITYMNNIYGVNNTGITVIESAQPAIMTPIKSKTKSYTMLALIVSFIGSSMVVVVMHFLKKGKNVKKREM